jgi:hypothetical protein
LTIYWGIDQTGAVERNGRPKPLPVCYIAGHEVFFDYAISFSQKDLLRILRLNAGEADHWLCIDCVLGLPIDFQFSWRDCIQRTLEFPGYGRGPAASFFDSLLLDLPKREVLFPRRKVEVACGANSVFQKHPFQKNIQTGTFRFWKEIALHPGDFIAPAVEARSEKNKGAWPIFEGYPSYSWKQLFDLKSRKVSGLIEKVSVFDCKLNWSEAHQRQVEKDPNLADAFVLALSIRKWHHSLNHLAPHPEGSILGYG